MDGPCSKHTQNGAISIRYGGALLSSSHSERSCPPHRHSHIRLPPLTVYAIRCLPLLCSSSERRGEQRTGTTRRQSTLNAERTTDKKQRRQRNNHGGAWSRRDEKKSKEKTTHTIRVFRILQLRPFSAAAQHIACFHLRFFLLCFSCRFLSPLSHPSFSLPLLDPPSLISLTDACEQRPRMMRKRSERIQRTRMMHSDGGGGALMSCFHPQLSVCAVD